MPQPAAKHPEHTYTFSGHARSSRVTHETTRADLGPGQKTERIEPVTDAYAKAGVDQGAADAAVAGLVRALGAIKLGRPSLQVPLPGHYASVIRIGENAGVALSTDGVGTKLLVAEELE